MIIALDAMGGDYAPHAVINGAIEALHSTPEDFELLLLGDEEILKKEFNGSIPSRISIHHCTDVITNHDQASRILKT